MLFHTATPVSFLPELTSFILVLSFFSPRIGIARRVFFFFFFFYLSTLAVLEASILTVKTA